MRWKNVASTDEYIDRVRHEVTTAIDVSPLAPSARLGDALFTGLRLCDGVGLAAVQARYGVDIWERFGAELEPFIENGLLERSPDRLWLTRQGMLLAHEVMAVFV
ncbi:MAG: hypothetical protein GEU82_11190 [Luteitalea sp.]|nr:hypothetical protein [Luteitalea sp.]